MKTDQETDGLSITESAKQAGAAAFAQAMGKGTYDALKDDALFPEMAALWDCATVGELEKQVNAASAHAGAVERLVQQARTAYLAAALVALGVRQERKRGR